MTTASSPRVAVIAHAGKTLGGGLLELRARLKARAFTTRRDGGRGVEPASISVCVPNAAEVTR